MPGKDGYLGVLPARPADHGAWNWHPDVSQGCGSALPNVIEGYAEVLPDRVIVLAESSERAEEINVERARASLERAQAELAKQAGSTEVDWERASLALERALVRVQAASKGGASTGVSEALRRRLNPGGC